MLKQCKHNKILYERIAGFPGLNSETRDLKDPAYISIPAKNTIVVSHCVECGKFLKSFEWNDNIKKIKVK